MKLCIKVTILCLFFLSQVFAQLNAKDFETFQLKALKKADKFGVFVWDIDFVKSDSTFADSLSANSLTNYINDEFKLRSILPVTFDEASDLPGGPSFDILTSLSIDSVQNRIACNISARFVQDVQLIRNVKIMHYSASTWTKNRIFISDKEHLKSDYYYYLKELVELFVKDYKSIN